MPTRWRSGEPALHFLGVLLLQCYEGRQALLGHTSGSTSATWDVGKGLKQTGCRLLHEPFTSHSKSQFWALWEKKNCWWERKDPLRKRSKEIQKEPSRYSKGLICQHFLSVHHPIRFGGLTRKVWKAMRTVLTSRQHEATAWCWKQKDSNVTESLF